MSVMEERVEGGGEVDGGEEDAHWSRSGFFSYPRSPRRPKREWKITWRGRGA